MNFINKNIDKLKYKLALNKLEKRLTNICVAADTYESQGVKPGSPEYKQLKDRAEELVTRHHQEWSVEEEHIWSQFPGARRLQQLSNQESITSNKVVIGILTVIAAIFAALLIGAIFGLAGLAYHEVLKVFGF